MEDSEFCVRRRQETPGDARRRQETPGDINLVKFYLSVLGLLGLLGGGKLKI